MERSNSYSPAVKIPVIIDVNKENQKLPIVVYSWWFDKILKKIKPGPFSLLCSFYRFGFEFSYDCFIKLENQPETQSEWCNYLGVSPTDFRSYLNTLVEYNIIQIIFPKEMEILEHVPCKYIINDPSEWDKEGLS